MSNFTASRLGANNGGGDKVELFLKIFGGEVLTALYVANKTMDKHLVRTIPHGKSAQFPVSGKGTASYHVPGTELNGTTIGHSERVISIDDKLVADRFIADIDEAMAHYDVRSIYSQDVGEALARKWDQNVLNTGVLAARAAATVTGEDGGTVINAGATVITDPAIFRGAVFDALTALAQKNVDVSLDTWCFVRPDLYYLLIDDPKLTNRDYSTNNGGVDSGVIFRVGGLPLVMTNNLPSTDLTGSPDFLTKYEGNFANTVSLIMRKQAIGTTKLMDMSFEVERSVRHQGTLVVGSLAVGSGILRPEYAVEITKAP
jgi:hypothetical protein